MRFLIIPVFLLAVSCVSTPETVPIQENTGEIRPPGVVQLPPPPRQQVQENFDPRTVTQAQYDSTIEEVRRFIEELNRIISNRNYSAWRAALSPEHYEEISSPEHLQQVSEQPALRTRRIVLRTAQDYFTHVVVPSRANSRVDDIEFVGRDRVKAYSINTSRTGEEQRLRLYDLEKIDNSWKIIN